MHNQGLYSYMACATLHKYERDMLELSISFRNEWSLTTILRFSRFWMPSLAIKKLCIVSSAKSYQFDIYN